MKILQYSLIRKHTERRLDDYFLIAEDHSLSVDPLVIITPEHAGNDLIPPKLKSPIFNKFTPKEAYIIDGVRYKSQYFRSYNHPVIVINDSIFLMDKIALLTIFTEVSMDYRAGGKRSPFSSSVVSYNKPVYLEWIPHSRGDQ